MMTQLSDRNMTQKLMNNEMRRGYSKLTKKIKLVQKKVFLIRIHFTFAPTHMGTEHKLQLLNTQTNLNCFIFSFL